MTEHPPRRTVPRPPAPRAHLLGWRKGQHAPTPFEKSLGSTPVAAHLSALHSLVEWATEPASPALQNADQHLREIAAMTRINPAFTEAPVAGYPETISVKVTEMLVKSRDVIDRACMAMMAHPELGCGVLVDEVFGTVVVGANDTYSMTCTTTVQLSRDVPFGSIHYKRSH